jgi:hypothetical protein
MAFIKKEFGGPVIVKGVMSPKVADTACRAGMDAVYVSNHGGRAFDGVEASISALPRIADMVAGRAPIIFDSGVRRGADVFKALALGATVVGCGRPVLYGVTLGGMEEMYRRVVALADDACDGRLLNTAGGGYNPATLGRIWMLQLGAMMGVAIGDDLPDEWRQAAEQVLGDPAPMTLREDPEPGWDAQQRAEGDRVGLENVARAEALLEGPGG